MIIAVSCGLDDVSDISDNICRFVGDIEQNDHGWPSAAPQSAWPQ